jgi:hypothetical protein
MTSRTHSADNVQEIRITLNELKCATSRSSRSSRKSSGTIEEELLKKHQGSKEKLDKKRFKNKSNELQNLKLIPKINSRSNKIIQKKHSKEIEDFIEKMKKPENFEFKEIQSEPIKRPDFNCVLGMFNSRNYLKKEPDVKKVNPNKLNILEKGMFYREKKNHDLNKAEEKKKEDVLKECTFKPDLTKTRRVKSFENLSSIFNTDEKNSQDLHRSPAPKPQISPKKIISNLIPDQVYSFKEGVNLKKILEKSRPLLSYNLKAS